MTLTLRTFFILKGEAYTDNLFNLCILPLKFLDYLTNIFMFFLFISGATKCLFSKAMMSKFIEPRFKQYLNIKTPWINVETLWRFKSKSKRSTKQFKLHFRAFKNTFVVLSHSVVTDVINTILTQVINLKLYNAS